MKNLFEIFVLTFFCFFCGYFPGKLITQFTSFKKEEKFVLSFAITFFIFYVFGFLSYVFNTNFTFFNGIFLLLFLLISLFFPLDFDKVEIKFLRNFFIVFFIFLLYQFFIPLYFGGLWYWDWFEHYLRSIFFLDRLPKNIVFEGHIIPSRPPFFNIVCFFYLSIIGGEFYKYQIVATFLNSMLILSIYLFCKEYFKIENKYLFLIVSVIGLLNPVILRQITYTWTKSFCTFYIILGLYFYLKFLKEQNKLSLFFSSFLFGTSFIVHFFSICYIIPVFIHLFYRTLLNRDLVKKTTIFYLIFLFVIFTYFSWSIKNYGIYKTFLATTAYQHQKNLNFAERIEKDIYNFLKTLNPIPSKEYIEIFKRYLPFYKFFNYLYSIYICTLLGNLTFSLSFLFLIIFLKNFEKLNKQTLNDNCFLIFFFFMSYFLGTVSNPVKELSGVAHTGLLPFISLIISFGIKNLISLDKKRFFIFTSFFFFETIFVLIVFIIAFVIYSNPNKIASLNIAGKVDYILVANFMLKYYNKLVSLYDKFFIIK